MIGNNNMMNEEPENEVPFGSLEDEVADDIPVMLSEGEYVIPADVVRYWGLKHLEEMRMMAKCGLMSMQQDGRLHMVDEEGEPVETDMPEAPQIEVVEIDIQAMQDDMSKEKEEENEDDDYDDMDKQMEMFEDNVIEVDFDGKDEEDILMLNGGGSVGGDGPADGQGDDVEDKDEDVGTGNTGTGGVGDPATEASEAGIAGIAGTNPIGGRGTDGMSDDTAEDPEVNPGKDASVAGANVSGVEEAAAISSLVNNMTKAEASRAKAYGVFNTPELVDKLGLKSNEDREKDIDAIQEARHSNNPTSNQMDLNALTEKGFQTENPGVVGVTNALAGTLASINPAIAATLAVGNIVNAATGKETIAGFGVPSMIGEVFGLGETSIAQAIGEQLSGLAQDVVDFSETVPGNIEDTINAGVEAGKEAGSSDDDQQKRQTELPDMTKLLSLTTQLQGIDTRVPIRNSLMSQAINNNRASQPVTT
jgi:hypothetical protein